MLDHRTREITTRDVKVRNPILKGPRPVVTPREIAFTIVLLKQSPKQLSRREKFRKMGQALTALEQDWAERRGELVRQEYRGCKSEDEDRDNRGGPTTLQIVELYDRRIGKRRPETEAEQAERKAAADARWEVIKQLSAARH